MIGIFENIVFGIILVCIAVYGVGAALLMGRMMWRMWKES